MSDGSALVLIPVAVAAVPLMAVAAGGYVVYQGTRMAVEAVRSARLAHASNRVATEKWRRARLEDMAQQLRVPLPPGPSEATHDIDALNTMADALVAVNDHAQASLEAEQAKLNGLRSQLAALRGRGATLDRWCTEAGLAAAEPDDAADPTLSAVEEATRQVAALTEANTSMEEALRETWRRREAALTADVRAKIVVPPLADINRDPLSSTQRVRTPLRRALERSLEDAALVGTLPPEVDAAHTALEGLGDAASVRVAVEAAQSAIAEAAAHRQVTNTIIERLARLSADTEALGAYVALERCDRMREEFDARADSLRAAELDRWAGEGFFKVTRDLEDTRRARELLAVKEAEEQKEKLAELTSSKIQQVMEELGFVSIPMRIGSPRGGHLFVEAEAVTSGAEPDYGRMVEVDDSGKIQTYTVRLGTSSPAADRAVCERHTKRERDEILPRAQALVAAELGDGVPAEGYKVAFEHREYQSLTNVILSGGEKQALADQVERKRQRDQERERPLNH